MRVQQLRRSMLSVLIVGLVCLVGSALGGTSTHQFGDWSTGTADDGTYQTAMTANLDGDYLGEFCYLVDKHCEWRFSVKNFSCEPGAKSTVLLNAKGGVTAVNVACIGQLVGNTWTSRILQWADFESVVQNNQEVGIALAGQGTSFRVIRFSLQGMNAATASIGGAINPNGPNAKPVRKDDEIL